MSTMTNASEWEAAYEQHRFDDEAHEERDYEPLVHARADIDARTFPCGLEADVLVLVGPDADVTCDGCNAELERRERAARRAAEAKLALAEQARAQRAAEEYERRQAGSCWSGRDGVESHGVGYGYGGSSRRGGR
jgi:hypothetical protein